MESKLKNEIEKYVEKECCAYQKYANTKKSHFCFLIDKKCKVFEEPKQYCRNFAKNVLIQYPELYKEYNNEYNENIDKVVMPKKRIKIKEKDVEFAIKNYVIKGDEKGWTLYKKRKTPLKKSATEHLKYYTVSGYFSSLQATLNFMPEHYLRVTNASIESVLKEIKEFKKAVIEALKPLKMKITDEE